jgi:uncharacterized protein DUF1918
MHARIGYWLITEGRTEGRNERRAEIIAVSKDDGSPPYTVRWADNGHEALVFPGPDSIVLTAEQLTERDQRHSEGFPALHDQQGSALT